MGLSFQDVLAIIAQQRRDYLVVYQSNSSPTHDKKYAFHALLALKKLEEEIKIRNDGSKTKIW